MMLVPFPVDKFSSAPTAQPSEALLNETAASRTSSLEGAGAAGTVDQRVPSQRSASGTPRKNVVPASAYPTAHASVGLTAADATRSGPVSPAGLGLGTTCSAVPAAAAGPAARRTAHSRPAVTAARIRRVGLRERVLWAALSGHT